MLGLVAATTLLTVLTAWLLRRWITRPIEAILAAVDRVSQGDLHHRIPHVGPAELARLAANIEMMRDRTVSLIDEAVRARVALEQQGLAIVTLREELEPSTAQLPPSLSVAATLQPAAGVLAGDWYDVLALGEGRVALIVVDVSGHGPVPGIFALRAKHLLLAALREGYTPGAMLSWLARHVGDTEELFLTSFIGVLDTATGTCHYANAGHPPALLVTADGVQPLEPTGPILGPLSGSWQTREFTLSPGAMLVVCTDGLLEARGPGGEEYGEDRLVALLAGQRDATPDGIVDACVEAVREFTGGRLGDDLTLVAIALESVAARSPVSRL